MYLEQALEFYRMAEEATDPKLKESLQKQGDAYRKLADKRATQLPPVNLPAVTDGGQLPVETTATETIINQKQFSNLTSSLKSNCSEWSRPSTLTRSTPKQPY